MNQACSGSPTNGRPASQAQHADIGAQSYGSSSPPSSLSTASAPVYLARRAARWLAVRWRNLGAGVVNKPLPEGSRLADGPGAGQSGGMLWLLKRFRQYAWIDWLLTRVESYTALLEQHGLLPYVRIASRAVAGAVLGLWTALAESWWPVGIAIAILVFVSLTMLSMVRSLQAMVGSLQAKVNVSNATDAIDSEYAISRVRLLCAALDQAADALQYMYIETVTTISRCHPRYDHILKEYEELFKRLTMHPHERLRRIFQAERKGGQVRESEVAALLRENVDGYFRALGSVTTTTDSRELIKHSAYAEWHFRHKQFKKLRDELLKDDRLERTRNIVGCVGLVDDKAYPDPVVDDEPSSDQV